MKTVRFWILSLCVSIIACGQVGAPAPIDASSPIPTGFDDAGSPAAAPPQKAEPATTEIRPAQVAPPPRAKPDPRTPAQLALAACSGPGGKWFCSKVKQPSQVMALGTSPIIPTSWTVPAWFIDPANSSGNASDGNTCTTSGAPCLTWHEINDHRWGCQGSPGACPRIQQNTTITYSSSVSTCSDPIYHFPAIESKTWINFQGTLPTGTAGTLSNVTVANRGTPTLTLAQVSAGAPAAGSFLVNTSHPSAAWANALSAGSIWKWSQPITRAVVPYAGGIAEVNTWANTDNVILYGSAQIPSACFVSVRPTTEDWDNTNFNAGVVYITNMNDFAEDSGAVSVFNTNVIPQESFIGREFQFVDEGISLDLTGEPFINNYTTKASSMIGPLAGAFVFAGDLANSTAFTNISFDLDTIITTATVNPTLSTINTSIIGDLYVSTKLNLFGSIKLVANFNTANVWGPGLINVQSASRFSYPAGAGAAVADITLAGGIQIAGQTKGCTDLPGSALTTLVCNITLSAANLDANLGATSGCLFAGPGAFCNFGQ